MDAWSRISATVVNEFSDISDLEDLTRIALRLLIAMVLGGVLGLERESAHKAAGLRTHTLVSLGSALFVLVSIEAGIEPSDLSRVVQGVVAGIGFLCAGAILKSADQDHVRGLTTSAGLWITAAIGLAAGLGREGVAVLSTLLALGVLRLERPVKLMMRRRQRDKAAQQRQDAP
ncbi:MAG TPA: MgtC/SapB family protein [Ramlibacter sp.]|nr:MgtC/SapB family protein [Ramlibacter sp.]